MPLAVSVHHVLNHTKQFINAVKSTILPPTKTTIVGHYNTDDSPLRYTTSQNKQPTKQQQTHSTSLHSKANPHKQQTTRPVGHLIVIKSSITVQLQPQNDIQRKQHTKHHNTKQQLTHQLTRGASPAANHNCESYAQTKLITQTKANQNLKINSNRIKVLVYNHPTIVAYVLTCKTYYLMCTNNHKSNNTMKPLQLKIHKYYYNIKVNQTQL
eukprot:gene3144-2126_t